MTYQSIRAICIVLLAVAATVAIIAWFAPLGLRPSQTTWIVRVTSTLLAIICLVFLFVHRAPEDIVPDYLHKLLGGYFCRSGFCFGFAIGKDNGVCVLRTYFQNQYDSAREGRIALRLQKSILEKDIVPIEPISLDIYCEAGAVGVVSLPLALPYELQGTRQRFEVGLTVGIPDGEGQRLRFRDGVFLRANAEFHDAFESTTRAINIATGSIVGLAFSQPASVVLELPDEVAEELPVGPDTEASLKMIWEPGDPPLDLKDE